jgi:hypothetical protein
MKSEFAKINQSRKISSYLKVKLDIRSVPSAGQVDNNKMFTLTLTTSARDAKLPKIAGRHEISLLNRLLSEILSCYDKTESDY